MTLYQIINPMRRGEKIGSSWDFTDDEYYMMLRNALKIDASITRHLGILKRKDKNSDGNLAVDEWGTWYKDEEGVLWYMYSTMRDALIQATVLNIFNKRSADLLLCSLCMSVNALSSVILTKGEQIIKNASFCVFKMYKEHQDATLVHSFVDEEVIEFDGVKLPCVSHSASIKDGKLLITLANCTLDRDYRIECTTLFGNYMKCEAEILHSDDVRARNTFDEPELVTAQKYHDFELDDVNLRVTLPHCSVMALRLS